MQAMRGAHRGDHALSSPRVVIYSTILVASLVPPVYLFVRSFLHRDASDAVVAVVCGVLYLLMLSRLWDVASFQRRAMVRERTLRMAGAALASATSAEEIAAAVQHAATALVSQPEPVSRGRVTALLAVRRDGRLRAVIPVRRDHARGRRRRAVGRPAPRADRGAAARALTAPGSSRPRSSASSGRAPSGSARPRAPCSAR